MPFPLPARAPSVAAAPATAGRLRRLAAEVPASALLVGAYVVSALTLAAHQPPGAVAETRFLAVLGGTVLAATALLAPARSRLTAAAALFATVAVWVLPAGLPRTAAVGVLLPAALLFAGGERWQRRGRLGGVGMLGVVLGLTALLRPAALLPGALDARAALLALGNLALVAALLVAWERRRPLAAPAAALATLLVSGGGGTLATLSLLAATVLALLPARWSAGVAAAAAAAAAFAAGDPQRLRALWPLVVLLPVSLLVARPRPLRTLAVLLAAAGGVLLVGGTAGSAPGVALLALTARVRTPAIRVERVWLALLAALGALLGGFPWLHGDPLAAALGALGLHRGWLAAAVALAAGALVARALREPEERAVAATSGALALAVAVALLAAMPPPAVETLPAGGIALTAGAPAYAVALASGAAPREVRAVTALAQAATLPAGTRVATLTIAGATGTAARWELRLGAETAEWAAARADLRGHTPTAPLAWSWVPPEGGFLAQAYGARWRPAALPPPPWTLRLERDAALPPTVDVGVMRLQVAR